MSYPRLAARLYNTPLLLEPGKAEVIEAVFRAYAEGSPAALPPRDFDAEYIAASPVPLVRADGGYYTAHKGAVAVLPVHGTLVQRANGIDALSGFTSYASLAQRFAAAQADPMVRATVTEYDTPGGEAAGVFDLGQQFAAAKKPVYAHANEMAFSAGYALASAAGAGLYMPGPALVGSVGVIMMHVDQSQMDAKRGLVYTPIFAGAKKTDFSSHAPLSASAKATAQTEVDRLYQIFVDHVASMRGIDQAAVRGTEAGLLTPGQAIDLRMADGIESFAETIQRAADESADANFTGYSFTQRRAGAFHTKGAAMADQAKAPAFTAEDIEKARAEGRAAAQTESDAKAKAQADASAKAAQDRVAAILGHDEAKGRTKAAQHIAFKTAMTVEDAIAMLASTEKESATTNALAEQMARSENKNANVDADRGDDEGKKVVAPSAANIYAFRRECVAKARAGTK